jgi:Mrp family chromosome partitioning ATPase
LNQDTGKPVCLVDTNWYWPSVPVVNSAGLAGVLAGTAALDQALVWVADTNLMLLPAGQIPENRRPTAARSAQIVSVIGQLRRHFAYVILDVPAVLATSDAIALTGLADGCCLVVRQGVTPVTTAREALDSIGHLPIMGVIMNRVHLHMPADLAGQLAQA